MRIISDNSKFAVVVRPSVTAIFQFCFNFRSSAESRTAGYTFALSCGQVRNTDVSSEPFNNLRSV